MSLLYCEFKNFVSSCLLIVCPVLFMCSISEIRLLLKLCSLSNITVFSQSKNEGFQIMEGSYNTDINYGLRWNNGQTSTRRGFSRHISEEYGCQTMRVFKSWTTFRHELSKSNAKQSILIKYRREDVIPTHISNSMSREFCFNSKSSQRSFKNCLKSFSKRILKFEIQDLFNHIAHIKNRLNALSVLLGKLHIDNHVITKFRYHTETKTLKIYNNFKEKLDKKLSRLLSRKTNNNIICNKRNWLINLTKESFPQDVLDGV